MPGLQDRLRAEGVGSRPLRRKVGTDTWLQPSKRVDSRDVDDCFDWYNYTVE